MREFIIKIIISFSFLILIFSIQFLISLRIKNKSTTGYDTLELTKNINAEVVFMGSSSCSAHFDPYLFEKTFQKKAVNIGVSGHSELPICFSRFLDYLKYNKPPKYLVLAINPFTRGNGKSFFHKNYFARYSYLPLNDKWKTVENFEFNFLEKYFPLYSIVKYKQLDNCLRFKNLSQYKIYGYDKHDKKWDTIKNPISNKLKKKYFKKSDINSIAVFLDSLNQFCRKKDIKLICIQTPVYKSIYDREKFLVTENMCSNLKIPFIDTNSNSIISDPKYFFDVGHLNTRGVVFLNSFLQKDKTFLDFLE